MTRALSPHLLLVAGGRTGGVAQAPVRLVHATLLTLGLRFQLRLRG